MLGEMGKLLRLSSVFMALGLMSTQAQPLDQMDTAPWTLPPHPGQPPPPPPPGMQEMPRIMNDTPEYCDELRNDIIRLRARRSEMPPDAAMLAREGERLCRIGHFRPGIFRLRTALMILRHSQ
jgi:hypothetical protein